MRTIKLMVVLLVMLLLSACDDVVSLAPLYDDTTLISVPELAGTWRVDTNATWTISPAGTKKYHLVIEDVEGQGAGERRVTQTKVEVGLVRLSGKLFMDLMSEDFGMTSAPAHIFARIEIEQDVLHVGWVDDAWMKEMLELNRHLTWSTADHGKIVLTSSTRDLQLFFRDHAWDEEAYLHGKDQGHEDPNTFFPRIR